jgi:hypothetical protein
MEDLRRLAAPRAVVERSAAAGAGAASLRLQTDLIRDGRGLENARPRGRWMRAG